jgi:hypothetical protein
MKKLDYKQVVDIIKNEPEYPEETAIKLKGFIKEAVDTSDVDWLFYMFQQAVRQTKQCLIEKIDRLVDE